MMVFVVCVPAQESEQCSYVDKFPRNEPLPDKIRERLIKLCIEEKKKEFNELIQRTEEVAKLSQEIEDSYKENNQLSSKDQDKLKEVDDLLEKIQKELRVDDDDEDKDDDKPDSTLQAIQNLKDSAAELLDEIKKTTRHTISAAAVQSTNVIKKLVKFLRFGK